MSTVGGVTGCVLDLNAQDNDSIVITGGKVSSWTDTAGGRVFSQSNDAKRPVMGTLNGEPAVEFDGVDDHLMATRSETLARPFTTVIVARVQDITRGVSQAVVSTSPAGTNITPFYYQGVSKRFNTAWHNVGLSPTLAPTLDPVLVFVETGSTNKLTVNGITATSGSLSGDVVSTTMLVGESAYGGQFWDGEIARILIFDHALTDLELVNLEIEMGLVHGVGVVSHPTDGVPNNNDLPDNRVLHLDAQDNDSITLIDGKVAKWVDKVSGREFIQVDPAKRPVMGTLNGKQAVLFGPTIETWLVSSTSFVLPQPFTVSQVLKFGTRSGSQVPFSTMNFAPGYRNVAIGGGAKFVTYNPLATTQAGAFTTNPVTLTTIYDGANSKFITPTETVGFNYSSGINSTNTRVGDWIVSGQYFGGLIGEIIVTSDVMSEQEQLGYRYRSVRYWGFSLPSGQQIVKLSRSDHPLGSPVWKK